MQYHNSDELTGLYKKMDFDYYYFMKMMGSSAFQMTNKRHLSLKSTHFC